MIHDVFWHRCSRVCSRSGQGHRARQVDITQVGPEQTRNTFVCVQRPAPQVGSLFSARRLAGARYQLDIEFVQAGIVGNGRHQGDPVVRSCDRYPNTDAICRDVLTPLVHRFQTDGIQRTRGRSSAEQQQRGEGSQSRASERPREASWVERPR